MVSKEAEVKRSLDETAKEVVLLVLSIHSPLIASRTRDLFHLSLDLTNRASVTMPGYERRRSRSRSRDRSYSSADNRREFRDPYRENRHEGGYWENYLITNSN